MLYNLIIAPIETIIDWVFLFISRKLSALGIISAVAGVSVIMNFMALPIYNIAEKIQQKEREISQKLAKQVKRIKQTFKGDEQFMMLQAYYKEEHYHPLYVFRSSLSILIEIPFFIAAYHYLSHCEALFGASFLCFKNLGLPDRIFSFVLGHKTFYINILPILMTLINFVSGAIYTKGAPAKEKIQLYGVALVFLVLLYNSPSGLVIYWILNNLFSLCKNIVLKMKHPGLIAHGFLSFVLLAMSVFVLIFKPGTSMWKKWFILFVAVIFTVLPYLFILLKKISFFNFKKNDELYTIQNKKRNFIAFIISSVSICILFGFTLPSSTIASSPIEFCFLGNTSSPFYYISNCFSVFAGFFVFWPFVIYFLFGDKVKRYEAILFTAFLITTLFNVYIFKPDYGFVDPTFCITNRLDRVPKYYFVLPLIIFALTGILYVLFENKKKQVFVSVLILSICISELFIGINKSSSIKKEYTAYIPEYKLNKSKELQTKESIKPVFNLSKTEKNVLVIFLDRGISSFFPHILNQFPQLNEQFSGFCYYPDTLSFGLYTTFGYPAMIGGYEYSQDQMNERPDVLLKDKHNEALLLMPTLFAEAGYDVTVANPSFANYKYSKSAGFFDDYDYIKGIDTKGTLSQIYKTEKQIDYDNNLDLICKKQIINFTCIECCYPLLRDVFQKTVRDDSVDKNAFIDNFSDLYYLSNLVEFNNQNQTYTFIGNETTHEPTPLKAPEFEIPAEYESFTTGTYKALNSKDGMEYQINAAVIKQLGKFFDYLKQNDVYDNTRIIIVSDHGYFDMISTFPNFKNPTIPASFNPLLLVKDFNSQGPVITDNTFMTNADTLFLAKEGLNLSDTNPFTNKKLEQKKDSVTVWMGYNGESSVSNIRPKTTFTLDKGYTVKENLFDQKNWKETNYKEFLQEKTGE
ncbi:MAG: YidC/Oxa1 family membrane protein insertase [Treponema sp.]|nr:YidC/Oxa1 family membrane protein insertase [Treponema sp.]